MEFVDTDGTVHQFADYMFAQSGPGAGAEALFGSVRVEGRGEKGGRPLHIQYDGKFLEGEEMRGQLDDWAAYGCIEPGVATSIEAVDDRGPVDLCGKHFVLIGAGSAMGPLETLLRHGATVVCLDLPGSWGGRQAACWRRILATARASCGTIIIPTTGTVDTGDISAMPAAGEGEEADGLDAADERLIAAAGCNLLEQPAEILGWLNGLAETAPGGLTVGNYTYLDGALFVKLTLCADAIVAGLCKARPETAIAFLGTPTDIHVVSEGAFEAGRANYLTHDGRGLEKGANHLSKGKYFVLNELPPAYGPDGKPLHLVDAVASLQGPNYLIAKRLQHWRSMVEYDAGHTVSADVAPPTRTLSVLSSPALAYAFGGMPYFKPNVIFDQETSSTLMAALLISNTQWEGSPVSQ
jgi:hypothetical protein